MPPGDRRRRYGEIHDYLQNGYADNRSVGAPSDDTQVAAGTIEQMLEDGGLHTAHLANRFCRERIFGIGSAVIEFVAKCTAGGPWESCGAKSAGNGALMRIAPGLNPHLRTGTVDLSVDAALCAALAHNDSAGNSACVAWVRMLWRLPQMPAMRISLRSRSRLERPRTTPWTSKSFSFAWQTLKP